MASKKVMTETDNPTASLLRAMGHSPFTAALGGEVLAISKGVSRMRLPWSEKMVGDPDTGVVHGGVITGMLDHCCGMAVMSALREMMQIATLDLRIDYMKPAVPQTDIVFEARCLKVTHEVAFVRASAFHTEDNPIAISTGTFMLIRRTEA